MKSIRVRKYNHESDYPVLCKWFDESDGWSHWDPEAISPHAFIVEVEGKPQAFSSYYRCEGCIVGLMGFTVANPSLDKEDRRPAVDLLLEHLFKHSENNGVELMYYATDKASAPMIKRFVDFGGVITDDGDATICVRSRRNFDYLVE